MDTIEAKPTWRQVAPSILAGIQRDSNRDMDKFRMFEEMIDRADMCDNLDRGINQLIHAMYPDVAMNEAQAMAVFRTLANNGGQCAGLYNSHGMVEGWFGSPRSGRPGSFYMGIDRDGGCHS